jgi:hypothetical protein
VCGHGAFSTDVAPEFHGSLPLKSAALDQLRIALDGLNHYSAVESLADPSSELAHVVIAQMGLDRPSGA